MRKRVGYCLDIEDKWINDYLEIPNYILDKWKKEEKIEENN